MQPRDPAAFRAKVMRRAVQIERRRRAARALVAVPTIVSVVLGVALIQQHHQDSGGDVTAAQAGEGAPLHAQSVDIASGTPWSVATRPDGSVWLLVRGAGGFKVLTVTG